VPEPVPEPVPVYVPVCEGVPVWVGVAGSELVPVELRLVVGDRVFVRVPDCDRVPEPVPVPVPVPEPETVPVPV